jgi:predicted outer membrane repeat protein
LGVDSQALLEGITITGGNGLDGAGVWLIRSDPVFSQCLFFANRTGELSGDGLTGWGQGAGVSCYLSNPVFNNCVFHANWTGGQGGGLYTVESSPMLTDCLFQDNEAGEQGGALYAQDGNDVLVRCTFHGNWSWDGGALYLDEGTDIRLTNCRFFGNAGHGSGGALFAAGLGLEVTNSLFSANLAFADGGAVVQTRGPGAWTNCTFNHNVARNNQGGQALALNGTTAVLSNCILWDHTDSTIVQVVATGTMGNRAEVILSHCDVLADVNGVACQGLSHATWGAGNLSVDPRFQNADGPDRVGGTPDDDLSLKAGSPCIDAGDNGAVPTDIDDLNANNNRQERTPLDLAGGPRFVDDPATPNTGLADPPLYPLMVDIGAYEYQKP